MITIHVNNDIRTLENPVALSEFMTSEGYASGGVAVALDGKVIRRNQWSEHFLKEGSDLLIINAAYGG